MHVLRLELRLPRSPALAALLRELRVEAPPARPDLAARHWAAARRGARGSYLLRDPAAAEELAAAAHEVGAGGEPGGFPDPALERLLRLPGAGGLEVGALEEVPADAFDRPVFILSAPRAGSTMLYDLLARSPRLWASGAESHGPIEGIPALGLAARGFGSHRLTDLDAEPAMVEALRCGLLAEMRDHRGRRWTALPREERPRRIRIVEKTTENALRVPFLRAAFPDARFVWLRREGAPNVSSIVEAWGNPGFVTVPAPPGWPRGDWHLLLPPGWRELAGEDVSHVAAAQWAAANRAILDDLALAPDRSWCSVSYEELVARPEEVVRRLCAFAEIPVDGDLLAAAERPLPVAATATSPPSPTKWRYNRAFDAGALEAFAGVSERARSVASRSPRAPGRAPVRYRCFLDELEGLSVDASSANGGPPEGATLLADPTLRVQLGVTIPLGLVKRARFRERFLGNHAIAWVEGAGTESMQPFWIPDRDVWRVAGLLPGRPPGPEVDDRLRRQLLQAGILVPAGAGRRRREERAQSRERAHEHFRDEGYCLLRDLLHPSHVGALRRYYRSLIAEGDWSLGDAQVAGRYGWHNEPLARFFHHQLTRQISQVAGERVRPTYVYVSAYQGGAILERHLDREQCKYTMSLAIDEAPEDPDFAWPLYFDTPAGTVSLTQALGDAVLFRGNELPHYRHRLPDGRSATALLFHFVSDDFVGTSY